MAVRLQFQGIRCFSKPQEAVIRPITLLVGENSSGKSTFLALCRIAHALPRWSGKALPFNEPPFLLGAYDQIACQPRARAGRARTFSLTIRVDDGLLRADFASRTGQPTLNALTLSAGKLSLKAVARGVNRHALILAGPQGRNEIPVGAWFTLETLTGLPFSDWSELLANDVESAGGLLGEMVFTKSDFDSLENALNLIRKEFFRTPYAFAPVRTSPRRTYDPVSAEPEPEGSHIPMLMATLARSGEKERWAALQSRLREFGLKSGLCQAIDIVNKGKKESDPFQVGVKTGGPVFNLIDVGYGVSQALPILVDTLQRQSAFDLFLLQQPEVHLHPKAQAELGSFFAQQADKRRRFVIETHSDYLVDRIRMEVRGGALRCHDVSLLYFERVKNGAVIHNVELDQTGSIVDPPEGFRQFFLDEERKLLGV